MSSDFATFKKDILGEFADSNLVRRKPPSSNRDNVTFDLENSTYELHKVNMSDFSRQELDAKLEAIEARMDGRVATIESKIDVAILKIENREELALARSNMAKQQIDDLQKKVSDVSDDIKAARNDSKSLKYWLVGTALATVIGLAALNATILSNMVASFESGKNTTQLVLDSKKQAEDTAALLKDVKAQVDAMKTNAPASK